MTLVMLLATQYTAHTELFIPVTEQAADLFLPGPNIEEKSDNDTWVGVETSDIVATLSSVDTGSGVETSNIDAVTSDVDTGIVVDAESVSANINSSDTGSGVETEESILADILSSDSVTASEAEFSSAVLTSTDAGSFVESALIDAALIGSDSGSLVDTQSLTAAISSADTATVVDDGVAEPVDTFVDIYGVDSGQFVDSVSISALLSGAESGSFVDSGQVVAALSSEDSGSAFDENSLSVATTSQDFVVASEAQNIQAAVSSGDVGSSEEAGAVELNITDGDVGYFVDEVIETLAVLPDPIFSMPSLVEILRQRSVHVDGRLSVGWHPLNSPPNAGHIWVRFDLSFVRPGKDALPPTMAGVQQDRIGLMFADVWTANLLKAGDRIRCLSGPITGTFDVRNIPDKVIGRSLAHHLEIEVVEVSQRPVGTYVPTDFYVPSRMRHLYASRVVVLRKFEQDRAHGTARDAWRQIEDVADVELGTPGEMMCRLDLQFRRVGKDQPLPVVAGRAQDRVGTLFCDVTPNLRAGDRLRCIAGDVEGTFEIRAIPDLAPNLISVHHMEVQIIEVSQIMTNVVTR